ncbi:uncharacterized protein E6C27_scaffold55G001490 [Cucumis melo var. makuwa]|uniref:Retrotransposon gag domain-containing protein n=1 Tax=Cucumis melo var. makuwa TaxID=1194695 RepID=A0A5A7UB33_CUCMM|nr:uncharacterized protein E6C27_scaffold55G001490 [Cucumis melo var. makuwa]
MDAVAGRVEGLLIQEWLARVNTLEANVGRIGNYEYEDKDFRATLDVVRNEIADVNTRLNLTMRATANQVSVGGAVPVTKGKVPEPKPFCELRDAKALENFIFDLEQYFKATDTITEEAKDVLKKELYSQFFPENVEILARQKLRDLKHIGNIREYVKQFAGLILDIRDMSEKDKVFCFVVGLKPWAKTKLYEQRVQDLTSAYAAAKRLFDLTSDSQDVRRHQSSSPGRNRNSRSSSPKDAGGGKRSSRDRTPCQPNTENTW